MKETTICIIFATSLLSVNAARLYGYDLEDAAEILDNALSQLRRKNGPYLKLKGIDEAYRFEPHVIYTFDAQLLDPDGKLDFCTTEVSLSLDNNKNSLIIISCGGVEKVRKIINQSLKVRK